MKVAILIDSGFDEREFFYPYYRFLEAGCDVDVIADETGRFKGKKGVEATATLRIQDAKAEIYDLLYIPGGHAPERLRKAESVLTFVRAFAKEEKTICAVCHGPLVLLDAGLLEGKRITAYPKIKETFAASSARFTGNGIEIDGNLITAAGPADLPVMMKAVLKALNL
jgi:protease I